MEVMGFMTDDVPNGPTCCDDASTIAVSTAGVRPSVEGRTG